MSTTMPPTIANVTQLSSVREWYMKATGGG